MTRDIDSERAKTEFGRFVQRGDEAALGRWFELAAPRLFAAALRRTRDPASAEDLVQDTVLQALRIREQFDPRRPLMPWLIGILNQLARRRRGRAPELADVEPEAPNAAPDEVSERRELVEIVQRTLDSLAHAQREVVGLWLFWHMSPSEIATALERPESTVRVQLHRGLTALRKRLPRSLVITGLAALLGVRGRANVKAELLRATRGAPAMDDEAMGVAQAAGTRMPMLAFGGALLALGSALALWLAVDWTHPNSAPGVVREFAPRREVANDPIDPEVRRSTIDTGRRAAHVTIRIFWSDDSSPAPAVGVQLVPLGRELNERRLVLVTDSEGVAHFDGVEPGDYRMFIDRGPEMTLRVAAGRAIERRCELDPGMLVRGRVVDQQGRAIPAARIWVGDHRFGNAVGTFTTLANSDGGFEVRGVQNGNTVTAAAPNFASPAPQAVTTDMTMRIAMPPSAGRIRGVVRGPQGRPVAGATIAVGAAAERQRLYWNRSLARWMPAIVRSDAEGRFETAPQRAARVPLLVTAHGFSPRRLGLVPGGDAREHVIDLVPGAAVSGTVTDPSGQPLEYARVEIETLTSTDFQTVRTDRNGRFAFASVDPRFVALGVRHAGFERVRRVLSGLAAGVESRAIDVVLKPLRRIDGVLFDEADQPLSGWRISIDDSHRDPNPETRIVTDTRGRFALQVSQDAATCMIHASEPETQTEITLCEVDLEEVEDTLALRVPGQQRATAFVTVRLETRSGDLAKVDSIEAFNANGNAQPAWHVDAATGVTRIGPLRPGEFDFIALPNSTDTPQIPLGRHRLAPNQTIDLGVVQAAPGGTLQLALARGDGGAVESPVSIVLDRHRHGVCGLGRANSCAALLPGDYQLMVSGDSFVWVQGVEFSIRAGEVTRVALELRPAASVRIAVPHPIPDGWDPGGWSIMRLRDEAGAELAAAQIQHDLLTPHVVPLQLPLGVNTVELATARGTTWSGKVAVRDLSRRDATVPVSVSRVR